MKEQLFDFFPTLLFLIAFKCYDLYIATEVLIVASLIQIFSYRLLRGKFKKLHIVFFLILLFFGGLTIVLKDPIYLKWKVTITNTIFGLVLLISQYVYKKPLVNFALKQINIDLPPKTINKANLVWALFFFFVAILNLFVAFGLPEIMQDQEKALDYWVYFKVWGGAILSIIPIILTLIILSPELDKLDLKNIKKDQANNQDHKDPKADQDQKMDLNL